MATWQSVSDNRILGLSIFTEFIEISSFILGKIVFIWFSNVILKGSFDTQNFLIKKRFYLKRDLKYKKGM